VEQRDMGPEQPLRCHRRRRLQALRLPSWGGLGNASPITELRELLLAFPVDPVKPVDLKQLSLGQFFFGIL
jgi:hypothetical protein